MPLLVSCLTILSAPRLVREKTSVRVKAVFSRKCCSLLSLSRGSTKWTECSTSSAGVATGATSTYVGLRSHSVVSLRISGGMVAENISVCRSSRRRRDDPPQRHDEAHVEHLVGFVENQNLDAAQVDVALLHQVLEPAGRGDEDVDALLQRPHLRTLPDAAVYDGIAEPGEFAVRGEAGTNLGRQLTRRREDQRSDRPIRFCRPALRIAAAITAVIVIVVVVILAVFLDRQRGRAHAQPLQRRQRERRRLAGAGLGAAHQVVPGEHRADGFLLDGRGRLIALGANGAEQRIGEAQIFKRSFRTQRTLSFIANELCCLSARRAENKSR